MSQSTHNLTLACFLKTLYDLTRPFYKNQVLFLKSFFLSYHEAMSKKFEIDYEVNQARVSQILHGSAGLPPEAFRFYTTPVDGDSHLKSDITQFLAFTVTTNRQKAHIYNCLYELLTKSSNLDPMDKQHILVSCASEAANLESLIFLIIRLLIREPISNLSHQEIAS